MSANLSTILSIVSFIFTIALAIGAIFAFRAGYSRQANEIQGTIIDALKTQNEAQERQIASCEKEISRLKKVVGSIQYALKRRGIRIEIDGDMITLVDEAIPGHERTVQIQIADRFPDDKKEEER